jgi:hypothetical protein
MIYHRKMAGCSSTGWLYESGGRLLKSPDDVFSGQLAPVVSVTDITPALLALAVMFFSWKLRYEG